MEAVRNRTAIVGAGPWGVYAFERLVSQFARAADLGATVYLVDDRPFGSGPAFDPSLPDLAGLNFPLGHVHPWQDRSDTLLEPRYRSLLSWLRWRHPMRDWDPERPVPRALVGSYFSEALSHLRLKAPERVRTVFVEDRVADLEPCPAGWRVMFERREPLIVRNVLLATGVPFDQPPDAESEQLSAFARREGLTFLDRYTAWPSLAEVEPGKPLAVRGMGLTFIDAALALTEGAGGRFVETDLGLRYQPSGREPRPILPFSRSGRLPAPKSVGDWPHRSEHRSWSLTSERVEGLLANAPLHFTRDVWPLIEREMLAEYVSVGYRTGQRMPPLEWKTLLDLSPARERSAPAFRLLTRERLRKHLNWALAGVQHSAERAVIEIWSVVFPQVARLASFGGLLAESHRNFDRHVRPTWGRLAFGPPVGTARKVLALLRSGVVDVGLAPQGRLAMDGQQGSFILSSAVNTEPPTPVRGVLDARVPKFDLSGSPPSLYAALKRRGLIRAFVNRGGEDEYDTGAVEVDRHSRAISANGEVTPGLLVIGAPTEGCVIGTDSLPNARVPWAASWIRPVMDSLRADLGRVGESAARAPSLAKPHTTASS